MNCFHTQSEQGDVVGKSFLFAGESSVVGSALANANNSVISDDLGTGSFGRSISRENGLANVGSSRYTLTSDQYHCLMYLLNSHDKCLQILL